VNARIVFGVMGAAIVFLLGMAVEGMRANDDAAELAAIREFLEWSADRLAPTVAPSLSVAPARALEPGARPPVTDAGSDDLPGALRELRDEIAAQGRSTREALRSEGPIGLDDIRAARPVPDPVALEEFARAYGQDESMAQMSMKLKTAREVIERFGSPDASWPTDRGFSLSYYRPGTTDTWVWISVDHGLVGNIGVETK